FARLSLYVHIAGEPPFAPTGLYIHFKQYFIIRLVLKSPLSKGDTGIVHIHRLLLHDPVLKD
ncbi:hypothetical protein ACFL6O_00830, partial [candidate division KSB1 bacterium]